VRAQAVQGQALTTERHTIYSIQYFLLVVFFIAVIGSICREIFGPDES
jgi:hypothetical protein